MSEQMEQKTEAEKAYTEFKDNPIAAMLGVDRASFIAGYDTAREKFERQRNALYEALKTLCEEVEVHAVVNNIGDVTKKQFMLDARAALALIESTKGD